MTYYATWDSNENGIIARNAEIRAFETLAEAEAYAAGEIGPAEWILEFGPGRWSDCWFKTTRYPHEEASSILPFKTADIEVLSPGEHPGGVGYWVTPRHPVIVVIEARERESEP